MILKKMVTFIGLAMLFTACGSTDKADTVQVERIKVKVAVAESRPITAGRSYAGTVEAFEHATLSTRIMGWVDKIHFLEGQEFERGDVLVELSSKDLQAKLSQTRSATEAAEVHLRAMETNYQRIKTLFEKEAATQKEFDDIEAAYASAKANHNAAQNARAEIEEMLRYANLRAPFSGVVARKMVSVGDLTSPGQPILELENIDKVKIVATVPETEIAHLGESEPVVVAVSASHSATNGKSREAKISRIVPSANPGSRSFEIHAVLENPDGHLKSGMFARVYTETSGRQGILIPKQAVMHKGQLEGVFVITQDQAMLRWIRTGKESGSDVEILSGLNAGDRVALEPGQLSDGLRAEAVQ
jgi:RND family efflux transporter MFP subunit